MVIAMRFNFGRMLRRHCLQHAADTPALVNVECDRR
jgi:hypothetical protein